MKTNRILFATNCSPESETTLRAACDIARGTDAALHILYAWEVGLGPNIYPPYPQEPTPIETMRENAEKLGQDVRKRADQYLGKRSIIHVRQGMPPRVIHDLSLELDVDLIVMGGHVSNAMQALFGAPISEPVLDHSGRPVLVLHGQPAPWPPTVVISCDDGSNEAREAIALGAEIARACNVPVKVIEAVATDSKMDLIVADRERNLQQRVTRMGIDKSVSITTEVVVGSVMKTLNHNIKKNPGCLVTLGTRGHSSIPGTHIGSVATHLLRAVTGAVLIVPHKALNRPSYMDELYDAASR